MAMRKLMTGFVAAISALANVAAMSSAAGAQMVPMGIPLTTTIVVTKPAPGQLYGDRQTVTMGVNGKIYKFVLKDGFIDDPTGKVHWPDVWQQVSMHTPNFMVTGLGEDTFEKIEPGQTLTVRGMYAPLNRNFEVTGTDFGAPFEAPKHY